MPERSCHPGLSKLVGVMGAGSSAVPQASERASKPALGPSTSNDDPKLLTERLYLSAMGFKILVILDWSSATEL